MKPGRLHRHPPDLDFDTNEATIRDLLSHRSGIPDYDPIFLEMARASQDSLTQMTPKQEDYGLGLFPFPNVGAFALGHPGNEDGYDSWSACLPEHGAVIVALANGDANELFGLARPLVVAAASNATDDTTP